MSYDEEAKPLTEHDIMAAHLRMFEAWIEHGKDTPVDVCAMISEFVENSRSLCADQKRQAEK